MEAQKAMRESAPVQLLSAAACAVALLVTAGCMAQQADLKQTERQLQNRIKQSSDELAQRGAQQRQELEELKGDVLPKLQGEIQRAQHQAEQLQAKQEDLKQRSAVLEQQTKKLEQLAGKLDSDNANRYSQVRESLNAQDVKNKSDRDQLRGEVNNRLEEINRQMEALRKDILDAVRNTNAGIVKSLDEQRKALADNQAKTDQLSGKFAQFSQALSGFRESLTALGERVGQEEQANKALTSKVDTDTKASTSHINETTKAMTGHLNEVNKSVGAVAQKLATRFDEQFGELNNSVASATQKLTARLDDQDRRIHALGQSLDQMAQDTHARVGGKNGQRQPAAKPAQRSTFVPAPGPSSAPVSVQESAATADSETPASSGQEQVASAQISEPAVPQEEVESAPKPPVTKPVERTDRVEYERLLGAFRDGDLEGARRGFTAFLSQYPNSDLAPNARYWLGESHYGKKDYKQAIDAYDRVEMDYPQSEKVPAAILKKGYAYLALKDKKRASSAFKQVVTLYPKSPEAGKASDKLSQLRESR